MPIISIIKVLLSIAANIAQYAQNKQLMDAGAAKAVLEGIKDVKNKIATAADAVARVDELPIDKDPINRANKRG